MSGRGERALLPGLLPVDVDAIGIIAGVHIHDPAVFEP
jgi:hypothetical protein